MLRPLDTFEYPTTSTSKGKPMSSTTIKILDNGPMFVSGDVEITDAQGNRLTESRQFTLCRCGLSARKPFCDGSHRPNGFSDAPRARPLVQDEPAN
jgi:CDGSH-type Zn-finger protein